MFKGTDGGDEIAYIVGMVLGSPLITPMWLFEQYFLWIPSVFAFIVLPANSFVWGAAVLCFLRGIRGLAADGSRLDKDES